MIEITQVVLFFVLFILTILVLALGVQVFFILRELRQTVNKTNKVLDDVGIITKSVSGPMSSLSSLASGVKTGALLAGLLKGKKQ